MPKHGSVMMWHHSLSHCRLAALTVALVLAGAAEARSVDLRTAPVPLNPKNPEQQRIGQLRYLGGLEINADDAEAVERDGDGSLLVSFERRHRLYRYPPRSDPAKATPARVTLPVAMAAAPFNGGIEAMAALADGGLLLVTEDFADAAGDMTGWLLRQGDFAALGYVPTGLFKPTDFAVLPGGDIVALERRFTLIGGVAARLQRIDGAAVRPGARLRGEEIARLERPLTLDNFEAVAAARDADGTPLLFVLSDDNFNAPLQRTLLLLFRLE